MLYQALLPADLVDQLALITFTIMLGRGSYSGDPATARSWTLSRPTRRSTRFRFAIGCQVQSRRLFSVLNCGITALIPCCRK